MKIDKSKFAVWLVEVNASADQPFPSPRRLHDELSDCYEPAAKPVSLETIRRLVRYAQAIASDGAKSRVTPPNNRDSTLLRLFNAVCELRSMNPSEQREDAGIDDGQARQTGAESPKSLEVSDAYQMLKKLYLDQSSSAFSAIEVTIAGARCGLEFEPPKSSVPSPQPTRILIIAVKQYFAGVNEVFKTHFKGSEPSTYSTVLILFDDIEGSDAAVLTKLAGSLRRLKSAPYGLISVKTTGRFLYDLFEPAHALRVLNERFSIATGTENFSLESSVEAITVNRRVYNEQAGSIDQGSRNLFTLLHEIAASGSSVRCMLRGGFGSGKTTAVYKVSSELLQAAEANARKDQPSYADFSSTPLPIIIPANEILSTKNLQEVFADFIREWYETPLPQKPATNRVEENQFLSELIRKGNLVVIIDGLDESPTLSRVEQIEQLLRDLPEYYAALDRQHLAKPASDKSKYVLTFRPEIFTDEAEEDQCLGTTVVVDPLSPLAFLAHQQSLQSLTIQKYGVPSSARPKASSSHSVRSVEFVREQILLSLKSSPLFEMLLAQTLSDHSHAIQMDQAYHRFKMKNMSYQYTQYPELLFSTLSQIAEKWAHREEMRDRKRYEDSSKRSARTPDRLSDCTEVALYMLGRPDCRRQPNQEGIGEAQFVIGRSHLSEVINRQVSSQSSRRDSAQSMPGVLPTDRHWYDYSVTMMLLKESTADTEYGHDDRWRFPSFAMESYFVAVALYRVYEQLNHQNLSFRNLEDPRSRYEYDPARYIAALNRSVIGDSMRAAILMMVGMVQKNNPRNPRHFFENPLSRQKTSGDSLARMTARNPVLGINIATISIWALELLDGGREPVDLSNLFLPSIVIAPWEWASGAPETRCELKVQSTNLEDAEIAYGLTGTSIRVSKNGLSDRLVRLQELAEHEDICKLAEGSGDTGDWTIVPGGEVSVTSYQPVEPVDSYGARRTRDVQSVPGSEGDVTIYVPSFLVHQHPVSNAEFLQYLQEPRHLRQEYAWPLAERRATSNPWYLYDWAGIEFLLGSDPRLWPNQPQIEDVRTWMQNGAEQPDREAVRLLRELEESRNAVMSQAAYKDWHDEWDGPKDPIEMYGWFFSEDNKSLSGKSLVDQARNLFTVIAAWSAMPVTRINWRVAQDYVRLNNCALPTESEFEAAARWLDYLGPVSKFNGDKQEGLSEFREGLDRGERLWSLICAQLQSYLPSRSYDSAVWRNAAQNSPVVDRLNEIQRKTGESVSQMMDIRFIEKLRETKKSLAGSLGDKADLAMPPSYLTGVVGTWTRDVYDPTWPLSTASKPGSDRARPFYPTNTGLTSQVGSGHEQNGPVATQTGLFAESALRTVRGRGLRLGWRRGVRYRFGQAETNVNPDVGIRCVKPLVIQREDNDR